MNLTGDLLLAGAAVVGLLAVVEALTWRAKPSFFATVILGQDGRTSTSKTFIFLWTLLIGWALIALLIAGEFATPHQCLAQSNPARACQGDELGLFQLGWRHFLKAGLAGSYLILLGVPAAAGIAAKGITQSQVSGPGVKVPRPPHRNLALRVTEIFSADDGTTDIGDFQYLIFNLVTATYFVAQFVNPDGSGLPTIPDTLLGLTSVSAGLYVGKKAVSNTQPAVTGVFPMPLHDGQPFTVLGTGLIADPASPTHVDPQITIDGMLATIIPSDNGSLIARAPVNLGTPGTPMVRQLRVLNPYGGITADFPVQCL